jgi:hypothetical protein
MIRKIIEAEQTIYFVMAISAVILWEYISNVLYFLLSLYVGYVIVKVVRNSIRKAIDIWILQKY